jgi:pimeloyl-ACP methyl ester carboxylesterase
MLYLAKLSALMLTLHFATAQSPTKNNGSTITWSACPSTFPPGILCSNLTVPLNYSNPTSDTATLFLSRLPCTRNSNSTGQVDRCPTLHYNPGGPGAATASGWLPASLTGAFWFSPTLRSHFDLVAFDPRGTGLSSGAVACDPTLYNERVSTFPTTEEDYETMRAHFGAWGRTCWENTGPMFAHLDTDSVARDLESLRIALGGEALTYLGQSYGTLLGARYAELFAECVRAAAWDGVVDYSIGELYTILSDVRNLELTLRQWEEWCTGNETCALFGGEVGSPGDVFDAVVTAAEQEAIAAPGCVASGACRENVTLEEVVLGVQQLLFTPFDTGSGAALSLALEEASEGNATLLSVKYETQESNQDFSSTAIACSIWQYDDKSYQHYQYVRRAAKLAGPRIRGISQFGKLIQTCSGKSPTLSSSCDRSLRLYAEATLCRMAYPESGSSPQAQHNQPNCANVTGERPV